MSSETVSHFEGIFLDNLFSHGGSDIEQQVQGAMRRSTSELIEH